MNRPPEWTRLREAALCVGCNASVPAGHMAWWQPGTRRCGVCGPDAGKGWTLFEADWVSRCACGKSINPGALVFWRANVACGACLPPPLWWPA